MKYIHIPETDLKLSRLVMGTGGIGVKTNEEQTFALLEAYIAQGGNVIDTARAYSDWIPGEKGRSERILGEWIEKRQKRDDFILITKGGFPEFGETVICRVTKKDINEDLEKSLKVLHVDAIDLYILHRDNEALEVSEIIEFMEELVREGKIRYYGCSNWKSHRIEAACHYAKSKGYRGFVANEMWFNVGSKQINKDRVRDKSLVFIDEHMKQIHKEENILALPYFSNCGGFFSKLDKNSEDESLKENQYYTEGNLEVYAKLKEIAKTYNCSVAQTVTGYLLHQDIETLVIFGSSNLTQLEENMKAVEIEFTEETFKGL